MAQQQVKILVACGSGIASSSVAAEEIKKICKDANIPIDLHKGAIQTIQSESKNYDLICTTSNFKSPLDTPVVHVFGLISGINKDKVAKQIVDTCNGILGK